MKNTILIILALLGCSPAFYTFDQARQILPDIYKDIKTVYCDCDWKDNRVLKNTCSYKPKKKNGRTYGLEFEHIVSASELGKEFPKIKCYNKNGIGFTGRNCLRRYYKDFKEMEGNLHNIWPLEGGLNITRSNKKFGIIEGESRKYGTCDIEFNKDTIEIKNEKMGLIARTYLYMSSKYPKYIKLSSKQVEDYQALNKQYPPTKDECLVNERISKIFEKNEFINCE